MHELVALYALDALDDEEVREFEHHLSRCRRCRNELDSLRAAAGALAIDVDAATPPPALYEHVLDRVRLDRQVTPLVSHRAPVAALALAAAAAVAVGVWSLSLRHQLDRERSAHSADLRVVAVLSEPDARAIPIPGQNGKLVIAPSHRAALVVSDLTPAPEGSTYEAWVIDGSRPLPAGTFPGGAGSSALVLTRPVPTGATVAVTLERGKGASDLTGTILFRARVS